jgi:hypothetical protein
MLDLSNLSVWSTEIPLDPILIEHSITMSQTVKSNRASNRGGWQGTFRDAENQFPWILSLLEKIKFELEKHYQNQISFRKFWMNVNRPGHSNDWHRHEIDKPAAVYYIQVPKNSGKILFKNDSMTYSIEPYSGLLLSFPGDIYHSVEENLSNESRISFAMNLRVHKNKHRVMID